MNNFDRLECLEFISDRKYCCDMKTINELLYEMDNITPALYKWINSMAGEYELKSRLLGLRLILEGEQ